MENVIGNHPRRTNDLPSPAKIVSDKATKWSSTSMAKDLGSDDIAANRRDFWNFEDLW